MVHFCYSTVGKCHNSIFMGGETESELNVSSLKLCQSEDIRECGPELLGAFGFSHSHCSQASLFRYVRPLNLTAGYQHFLSCQVVSCVSSCLRGWPHLEWKQWEEGALFQNPCVQNTGILAGRKPLQITCQDMNRILKVTDILEISKFCFIYNKGLFIRVTYHFICLYN